MAKMTIEIDEKLLAKALDLSGAKTKREAVHTALEELVWRKGQDRSIDMIVSGRLRGTTHWTPEEFKAWRSGRAEKLERMRKEVQEKGVPREPAR